LSPAGAAFAQQPAPPVTPVPEEELLEEDDLVEAMRRINGIKIKSLFFTRQEVGIVRYAYAIYAKLPTATAEDKFNEEAFLKQFAVIRTKNEVTVFTYPQFFLDSIVYHHKNNWIAWINNKKITQDTAGENSELRIIGIDENKVVVEWKPLYMDKVAEVWQKTTHKDIKVNTKEGTVVFTLRPNQTFTSYQMKVVEGKVQPVTIGNNVADAGQPLPGMDMEPPADLPIGTPIDPVTAGQENADSNQGLSGLLNQYKKMEPPKGQPTP
jgi:hypothetical protein